MNITKYIAEKVAEKMAQPMADKIKSLEANCIDLAEKAIIKQALEDYRWQKGKAAEALGIHRKTLFTKMKKLGLE